MYEKKNCNNNSTSKTQSKLFQSERTLCAHLFSFSDCSCTSSVKSAFFASFLSFCRFHRVIDVILNDFYYAIYSTLFDAEKISVKRFSHAFKWALLLLQQNPVHLQSLNEWIEKKNELGLYLKSISIERPINYNSFFFSFLSINYYNKNIYKAFEFGLHVLVNIYFVFCCCSWWWWWRRRRRLSLIQLNSILFIFIFCLFCVFLFFVYLYLHKPCIFVFKFIISNINSVVFPLE